MSHTFFLFVMKKVFLAFLIYFFSFQVFSVKRDFKHTYAQDYSLFPKSDYSSQYSNLLKTIFPSSYCFQSVMFIPRSEMKGYPCKEVLTKLDQMGGIDKECFGVSYKDGNTGRLKPIFKKSEYNFSEHELYVKDKTAGGLHFDLKIDEYYGKNKVYGVMALLKKNPDNIFLREIKKNEACIFVFIEEMEEGANLYVLIQCKFSPLKIKILKRIIENAISGRVLELQNWFYRMICTPQLH